MKKAWMHTYTHSHAHTCAHMHMYTPGKQSPGKTQPRAGEIKWGRGASTSAGSTAAPGGRADGC